MTEPQGPIPGPADLEMVLLHAADAITVQASDGSLVYANLAAARTLGFESPEELLAKPIREVMSRFELLDEEGRPLPLDQLPSRRALAGQSGAPSVVRFRDVSSGDDHWSLVQAMPILDEAGDVRLVINTFQDVSQLKRTEQQLRLLADAGAMLGRSVDYQEALQELADLLVGAITDWCVVDVLEPNQPVTRVAVAHADPAKRGLAEEIQRRYPTDPDAPGGVRDVIRTGKPIVMTEISVEMLRAAAQDDEHFRLLQEAGIDSAAIVPLRARNEVFGALTLVGSSDRHRLTEDDLPLIEELARRAATAVDNARLLHEANEAIRMRDDFLAMASHDMRTPLAVILANLQLARRRVAGHHAEQADVIQNLDAAERTTHKLTGLVGELMDISILRSGQPLPLSRETVDLATVAEGTADEYRRLSAEYEIDMRLEPGVIGNWDAIRIERVLRNLLDNALKYSPDGGTVEVVVRSEGGWAVAEVTDHGVGIPEDELPLLFEKFHRGSNTRDLRGTGLGLAGSRAVMQQLGGTIEVRSRLGEGSTFSLRLPRDGAPGR
ncbi:MAG TPA: ATP-binding protein [Candidatus Limnocylindrales bacterium]|nr:ATP-binding protein [Candidatus Limnocylindrales bacterium]